MKLRTIGIAAVAAVALVAGSAQAQEAGWDTNYGILFTVPQLLGGRTGDNIINSYDGLVGFQYNLGPQSGLRLGANLLRQSCGDTEYTNSANVTFKDPGVCPASQIAPEVLPIGTLNFNSEVGIDLSAEYMIRATTSAISPYFGVGASINFDRKGFSGESTQSNLPGKTEYKDSVTTFGLGLVGKAGLEWRVHKVVAFFAEYELSLPLVERGSFKIEESTTGLPTYKADGNQTTFFNLSTGTAHGGQLGVVAFF